MAVKATVNKRPFVNCKRTVMWKMISEEYEAYSPTPVSFADRLTTYTDGVENNITPLYGDGKHIEDAYSEGNGTLSLGLHHIADDERAQLYGERVTSDGAVISTGEETPPYFCVALMAVKQNGRVNLRKYFKVMFSKHEESVSQQESGGVNYSMPTLSGTYSQNVRLGMKSVRIEVDPNTADGAAFIENWYSNPNFIGDNTESELDVNQSFFTLNGDDSEIDPGDNINSGSTIYFHAIASGGAAPYTYQYGVNLHSASAASRVYTSSTEPSFGQMVAVAADAEYDLEIKVTDANHQTSALTLSATLKAPV